MTHPSSPHPLDESIARTVIDLADHLERLRNRSLELRASLAATERGYFSPSEDDQVTHLWVSYHMSRAALLELVDSIQREIGKASRENLELFVAAYGATLALVHAARGLRDQFGDQTVVRRKLNEAFLAHGIIANSFDAIQMSLTNPANAVRIQHANQFYDTHVDAIHALADQDEGMRDVIGVIDRLHDATAIDARRYVRARVRERARQVKDQLVKGSVAKAVYSVQEWGSRLVSGISTQPRHVAQLPQAIQDQVQSLLQPGDIFVTRKDCAVTNYFLPGYWPHAAMYVGDGKVVESLKDGVRERTLQSPFGNDAVAVIRARLNEATIEQAIQRARTHLGKPYDFDFDFTRSDRMVCTEVIYRSYEGLGGIKFKLSRRAGRETLSAEDLLHLALHDEHFEQVVVFCRPFGDAMMDTEEMSNVLRQTMGSRR